MAVSLLTPQYIMRMFMLMLHTEFGITNRRIEGRCYLDVDGYMFIMRAGDHSIDFNVLKYELEWTTDGLRDSILRPAAQALAFGIWSGAPPHVIAPFNHGGLIGTETLEPDA